MSLNTGEFHWWFGVVENRKDPLNVGRVQIRIFGKHTDNKINIPTSELPWAQAIVSGDERIKPPVEGAWVFGFFMDGNHSQFPCYIGVLPGIPINNSNIQKGFNDPRTTAELGSAPQYFGLGPTNNPKYTNEPTTSRVYRNENIDTTVIGTINKNLKTNIPTNGNGSWNEPKSSYSAVPPYDNVYESESGHLLEFDDTPNNERINISHRTGTYQEIRPDGSKTEKIVGDRYVIIAKDDNVYIEGVCNITVTGNANIYGQKDINVKSDGNMNFEAAQFNFQGPISTNSTITAAGDVKGNGISLDNHTHPDPQGGNVGKPIG